MASPTDNAQAILAQIQTVGAAYAEQKPGAREQLLSLSSELTAALELPSETIQRIGWAEVSTNPWILKTEVVVPASSLTPWAQ